MHKMLRVFWLWVKCGQTKACLVWIGFGLLRTSSEYKSLKLIRAYTHTISEGTPVMIAKGNVYNMELSSLKQMMAHFVLCNRMSLSEVHKAHELVHRVGLGFNALT